MIDVKKILEEEGQVRKLEGNAPEGFILVHEKTLEQLKDFDVWKSWIHNERTIKEMNKINFENE
jgi:class 3 adenylate cyclase